MGAGSAQHEMVRDEVFRASEESLAAAYSTDFLKVADFYSPTDWRTLDGLMKGVSRALEWGPNEGTRIPLSMIVSRYLKLLGAPKASLKNAAMLADSRSVAIVTGQQPGLAGGPLMLLQKVAHAVRLAEVLTEQGIFAIPVFWAASEDHDLAEVNQFSVVNSDGKLKTSKLARFEGKVGAPLETLKFEGDDPGWDRIEAMVRDASRGLGEAPNATQVDELLKLARRGSFGTSCNRMLLKLFGHRGLVVVEPRLLRKLNGATAVIERELTAAPTKSRAELHAPRKRLVEAGYRPIFDEPTDALFWVIDKGKRHRVVVVNGKYTAECFAKARTKESMLRLLEKSPTKFSCGARLRPVMQGACFPVLAYIGGPSEIAYHAELCDLFKWHGIPMPALLPRWSGVLVERGASASAARTTIADGRDAAARASAAAAEYLNEARGVLRGFEKSLGPIAPSLAIDIAQIEGRGDKALRELIGRIGSNPLREMGVSDDERAKLANMYPGGQPLERVVNWLALWPRWGETLTDWWHNRDPFAFGVGTIR